MSFDKPADSKVLYHYTCTAFLSEILRTRYLKPSTSNYSLSDLSLYPVVWLTSSPTPDNMGLLFRNDMPDDLNKTHVRFTIRKKPSMRNWLEWSIEKGMDEDLRRVLITTALAEKTHKTWYVAEGIIPINDILVIENIKTGDVYYCKETGVTTSLTIHQNKPKVRKRR